MKENQTIFVCSNCGEEYLKWQGRCSNCGEWNTLKEFKSQISKSKIKKTPTEIVDLSKVPIKDFKRISTKIGEFDRVLGNGIVPGSVILLGGDPGIGKSTLVLQMASSLKNVLYISGEESSQQIKLRFDRLGLKSKDLKLLTAIDLEEIINAIETQKPQIVIIDSIQTIYSNNFPSTPGSLVQVRECALRLQQVAKASNIPIILIGHVTKEGTVAGPRTLEHLVDVVLYLEGERFRENRILRGAKNRFGATDEIGIFEMSEAGLKEVVNPSKLFLEERRKNIPGSVVTATIEGTRAFLVEVQALTSKTIFGYPQRRTSGFDLNRLQLIVAILQNRAGLKLGNFDVYLNVAGGFNLHEPAADLAVALAITSVFLNFSIKDKTVIFGEMGLGGEIRAVNFQEKRFKEAKRMGFTKIIKAKNINQAIRDLKTND